MITARDDVRKWSSAVIASRSEAMAGMGWLADVALIAQLSHKDAMHDYRDRFSDDRLGKLVKHKPVPEKPKA